MSTSNVLRVGILTPVQNLSPRETCDFVNMVVAWQIYETLYAPAAPGMQPTPLLLREPLTRVKLGNVAGRCAFRAPIASDVKFSDGTLMTAEHVARSLRSVKAFAEIADVSAQGDQVHFALKRPEPQFETTLTPLPRVIVHERGNRLYGTGAYMPAPDATPEKMRLVRNPHYRGEAAIDAIEFVLLPRDADGKATKLRQALKQGEIDLTAFLRKDEVADLPLRKSVELGTSTAILFLNCQRPAFRSPLVRRAVAHAIDRSAIARLFYNNPLAYVANGLLPPALGNLPDGLRYDPDEARALLKQAGTSLPREPISLLRVWGPRPHLPDPVKAAELIAQQLEAVGLRVKIEAPSNVSEYLRRTAMGDHDATLSGWVPDTPDPVEFLEVHLGSRFVPSSEATAMTCNNLARYRNPEMDQAVQRYREHQSAANAQEVARLMREDAPLVPLVFGSTIVVHGWRLKGYPQSFVAYPRFAGMSLA